MERDTGEELVGESDIASRHVIAWRSEQEEKIPVNVEKYEGKTESAREGSLCIVAGCAKGIRNLIGESSAIIFFLRKSSSELPTSY